MSATTIVPEPTRATFSDAIRAADKAVNAAALTGDQALMKAARSAQYEAWSALERFDAAHRDPR